MDRPDKSFLALCTRLANQVACALDEEYPEFHAPVLLDPPSWVNMDRVLAMARECGLAPRRCDQAQSQAVQERYEDYTQQAIDCKVFGAPSYVIDGEIFWGQDRLDFVERALKQKPPTKGA